MFGFNHRDTKAPADENSPNTDEPDPKRISRTPLRDGHTGGGVWKIYAQLEDGTSVDATVWVLNEDLQKLLADPNTTKGAWTRLAAPLTVLDGEIGIIDNVPPDTRIFVQMSSVVGGPAKPFGYTLI